MQVKRTGLKRLVCTDECGCLAYMTLSQLERFGCPVCPCGGRMVPEDLEVASLVLQRDELERHPQWREMVRECNRISHGQASHIQRGRSTRAPEAIAAERVAKAAKADAVSRRLSGLVQFSRAADAAAAMPF